MNMNICDKVVENIQKLLKNPLIFGHFPHFSMKKVQFLFDFSPGDGQNFPHGEWGIEIPISLGFPQGGDP